MKVVSRIALPALIAVLWTGMAGRSTALASDAAVTTPGSAAREALSPHPNPDFPDSTFMVSLRVAAGPDNHWRLHAGLRSLPVASLSGFLRAGAGPLRGGSVTGQLEFQGPLPPAGLPHSPVHAQGTLCADSLWWPAGETYSEWTLREANLCVDVSIRSDSTGFRYAGFVEAESGWIRYLGHDFPILSFRITFLDSTHFDPVVDLLAEAPVRSNSGTTYRVRFDLAGPLSQVRPRLTTEPDLGRQDIESLLALGVPLSAFSDKYVGDTGGSYWAQQVFMLRAMEIAADRVVGITGERAQKVLGVDRISVPTARGLVAGNAEMGVAKRLGSRATLSYSTPMWHLGAYRARLDFRLTGHLSLESENDHTGDSGIDLRFKVRWR